MKCSNRLTPFGREVRKRLIDLDMEQGELIERIGCHRNYLLQILDGSRSGEKYKKAICDELGLPYNAEKGA